MSGFLTTNRWRRGALPMMAGTLLFLLGTVCPAEVPLSVEVDSSTPQARSDGPIPVTLRLRWHGPGVFDGSLRLSLVDAIEGTLARIETDPLYLMEEEQLYRLLLPAFHASDPLGELELRVVCLYDGEQHRQPTLRLRVPRIEQRRLTVLVVGDSTLQSANIDRFANTLKLEPFNPLPLQSQVSTLTQSMTADLLAEDPLQLCPFDLVVVPPGEFERIKQKQLDALYAWTLAGGSLLVLPEGPVGESQLAFLDDFVSHSDRPEISFVLNTDGQLILPEGEDAIRLRTGLGRVVLARSAVTSPNSRNDIEWRRTTAFLWKLQQAHVESIVKSRVWDVDVAKQVASEYGMDGQWRTDHRISGGKTDDDLLEMLASRLYPQTVTGGSGMLERLLPSGLRLVPIGLMFLLLLTYLAAIGPFDYWFLGMLRLRKLTWVLFPAMTVAFTSLAVWTSNQYMSSNDDRTSLIIRDVAEDGRPLRENRIELLFPGRSTTMTTDYQRSLFMPLNHESYMATNWRYHPNTQSYEPEQQGMSGAPLIAGQMPARVEVRQRIAQWTPQLNRSLSIPQLKEPSETILEEANTIDWAAAVDWSDSADVQRLTQRIKQAFGADVNAYVYHQTERQVLAGSQHLFKDEAKSEMVYMPNGVWSHRTVDFLQELCVRSQPGWFGVVSQTSPGCGPMLEDLAILDRSDPYTWLLVIAVEAEEETLLYRKLYRQEPVE